MLRLCSGAYDLTSFNTTHHLLQSCWTRTIKTRFSRPEDDTSVSIVSTSEKSSGLTTWASSISQFQAYFQPVTNAVRHPRSFLSSLSATAGGATPETILGSLRNVNRQQLATLGVVGAEVLGFFTVGTMIGRGKIVGYRGGEAHGH